MAVLNQHLTRADWVFVQGIWDTIQTLWPEIKNLERRLVGVPPPEIERRQVVTPHGTFEGGYFPVAFMSGTNLGAKIRDSELMPGASENTTKATTGHGWTNARTKVTGKIQLGIHIISSHLDQVILDLTHREAIHAADKLLRQTEVKTVMREILGDEFSYERYWRPWLKHLARDTSNTESLQAHEMFARKLRINYTVFKLGLRASTLIMQIAGHFNAFGLLRREIPHAAKYWVNALFEAGGKGSLAKAKEVYNLILLRSEVMRSRVIVGDRDLRDTVRDTKKMEFLGKNVSSAKFGRWALSLIAKIQLIFVDVPIFLAAEAAGKEEMGMTEAQAVIFAEGLVRRSQGSGNSMDLSSVQQGGAQGNEWMKAMTMFFSYNNTQGNQVLDSLQGKKFNIKDTGAFLADYSFFAIWPAAYAMAVHSVGRGRAADEDEPLDAQVRRQLVTLLLGDTLGAIPFARDAWPIMAGRSPRMSFAYKMFLDDLADLGHSKDELDTMFDIIRLGALAKGLPGEQIIDLTERTLRGE